MESSDPAVSEWWPEDAHAGDEMEMEGQGTAGGSGLSEGAPGHHQQGQTAPEGENRNISGETKCHIKANESFLTINQGSVMVLDAPILRLFNNSI